MDSLFLRLYTYAGEKSTSLKLFILASFNNASFNSVSDNLDLISPTAMTDSIGKNL